jgi:hypothetical protein
LPKVTNSHNAPLPFIHYASNDSYDKGDADFSVTTLIDSPQINALKTKFPEEEEVDPFESRNLWRLVGTALHHIMEDSPDVMQSEGTTYVLKKEERIATKYRGYKLSGGIDLQTITESEGIKNVVVGDYKFTTTFSAGDSETLGKYAKQLNLYRWIIERETDLHVTGLEIYAVLRDWKPSMAEKISNYPDAPGQTIPIPLWSQEKLKSYVDERLDAHIDGKELHEIFSWDNQSFWGTEDGCTEEERWSKSARYKVIKNGGSRAVPGGGNIPWYRANRKREELGDGYEIVKVSPAIDKRCEGNYCGVSAHCSQYQE